MQVALYNENYQRDIRYITMLTRNILIVLGIWIASARKKSTCARIFKYLHMFFVYAILCCSMISVACFWIIEKRARVRFSTITFLAYGISSICKYSFYIIREAHIRCCLNYVEEDWKNAVKEDIRNTMLEFARKGKRQFTFFAIFAYMSGLSLRTLVPLSKGKIINEHNVTIKPFPYPIYLFSLDIQSSPVYEMLYTLQCLCGLVTFSLGISLVGLITIFVMHACGQLKILMNSMQTFVHMQWQEKSDVDKKLAQIIEHHTKIRGFLQLVEYALQYMCFLDMIAGLFILSILGYFILTEWENSNALIASFYLFSIAVGTINMFMLCYMGEQLIVEEEKMATLSSELEWYRLPNKTAREFALVVIMSNIPTKLTAGQVMDLSFQTFGDAIKTIGAYLNVFRTID